VRFGAFLSRQWQGYTFGAGDHTIPLQFPTDIFDNSHYFLGRGASVTVKNERLSVFGLPVQLPRASLLRSFAVPVPKMAWDCYFST
jgi:hypothetical protein